MQSKRIRIAVVLAVGLLAAVALAACGGDDDTTTAASSTTENAAATGGGGGGGATSAAQVDVDDNSELGQILVDGKGMTLYLFEKDTSADASTCSGACAEEWPPLLTKGTPKAGSGVDASKLTTFKRDDGTTQVSYGDWPLYYYAGDSAPGDTTGNNLDRYGALWYAVTPSGGAVKSGGSSGGSSSSSSGGGGGGGGYGY